MLPGISVVAMAAVPAAITRAGRAATVPAERAPLWCSHDSVGVRRSATGTGAHAGTLLAAVVAAAVGLFPSLPLEHW